MNKVANTDMLIDANRIAVGRRYNRTLSSKGLDALDNDGLHVLQLLMVHEHAQGKAVDPHMRVMAFLKVKEVEKPQQVILDIPMRSWNDWPTAEQVKEAYDTARRSAGGE